MCLNRLPLQYTKSCEMCKKERFKMLQIFILSVAKSYFLLQQLTITQNLKRAVRCCDESSDFVLVSSVAGSNRLIKLMGHPRRALRNILSWISGRKSVSHRHNAAKVKAPLFCRSGEHFQEQKSHRVLSSPASSRVAKPSTALQLTPLPSICELSPGRMNYGSQKYSWTCF